MASTPSSEASDLTRVVDVSERIKELSRDAAQMRIQAMNARVQTRSAGATVPGFEMVSIHMSDLSQDLDGSARRLRDLTVEWVRAVSGLVGCDRQRDLLRAVDAGAAPAAVAAACARNDAQRGALTDHVARCRRAFLTELEDAERMSALGCMLASSAKIEATYGGSIADRLGATAGTFAQVARDVHDAVTHLIRGARMRRGVA